MTIETTFKPLRRNESYSIGQKVSDLEDPECGESSLRTTWVVAETSFDRVNIVSQDIRRGPDRERYILVRVYDCGFEGENPKPGFVSQKPVFVGTREFNEDYKPLLEAVA